MSLATERLARYVEAETQILKGQQVRMGERYLSRADLGEVRAEITKLQAQVNAEKSAASGRRTFGSALSDFTGRG